MFHNYTMRVLICLVSMGAGICFGIGIEQMFKGCP